MPDFVFSIEASDQFIKQRIMKLPETQVAGTKNAEDVLIKRLEDFRKTNTDELTVLNFFDELEIHPVVIHGELLENNLNSVTDRMVKLIGNPRNYGATAEKIAEDIRILESARIKAEEIATDERAKHDVEELERQKKAIAEWVSIILN
jgi:adenylate kinase